MVVNSLKRSSNGLSRDRTTTAGEFSGFPIGQSDPTFVSTNEINYFLGEPVVNLLVFPEALYRI